MRWPDDAFAPALETFATATSLVLAVSSDEGRRTVPVAATPVVVALDTAGVAALRDACSKWLEDQR